jgi:hypothetical protein
LTGTGCPFSPEKDKPPDVVEDPFPASVNIDILLDNFLKAYTTMNYNEYEKLLDEAFEFVFDPDDIGEENGYKERYSRGEELDSTRNMFSQQPDTKNRIAQSIRMSFVRGEPEQSPENDQWKKVVLSTFELEVEAIQADDGETWFLRTKGGYFVDLHVVQSEEIDPATDARIWKIIQMVDRPPQTKTLLASS